MFKYLYGLAPYADEPGKTRTERAGRVEALLFTKRRDIYQHKDLSRQNKTIPYEGGFASPSKERPMFFTGESVSCSVKTLPDTTHLQELAKNGNWFFTHSSKLKNISVAIVLPEGKYPCDIELTDWAPTTQEEYVKLICEEDSW